MLNEFLVENLAKAQYKILKNKEYFGEISGLRGVWASANNLEDCRVQLKEVLEDWLLLKISMQENVPGFKLKIDRRALVKNA